MSTYRSLLPSLGSGLTGPCGVHTQRLHTLLARLARDEQAAYHRRARYRRRKFQEGQEAAAQRAAQVDSAVEELGGWVSIGELTDEGQLEEALGEFRALCVWTKFVWGFRGVTVSIGGGRRGGGRLSRAFL
eukprot:351219-Chlamydomonas_euryale.AAC.1